MTGTPEMTVDLAAIAAPAIQALMDRWVIPLITNHFRDKSDRAGAKVAIEAYLSRTYAKLSCVNTLAFANQNRRLQDIYIPLTVENRKKPGITLTHWSDEFCPQHKRVLVTDTAGMGKSTLLKWLFLCSVAANKGIPVFIELRNLRSDLSVMDKVASELGSIEHPFSRETLEQMLTNAEFVIFFDGFDEIPMEHRDVVVTDIQQFLTKANKNTFLMSSRREVGLAAFADFVEYGIRPLTKEEAFTLIRKYDRDGDLAMRLLAQIKGKTYETLKDLLANPLLVSLLYKAYSYKPAIPLKKPIFYRQVFDALYDMHDLTKDGHFIRKKHSGLDIDDFHRALRYLGFITAKVGAIEYTKDQILALLVRVRDDNTTLVFQPAAFLQDLFCAVPLFQVEGETYKWAHRAIQDYFASQFICIDAKGAQTDILRKICTSERVPRYANILDLCYETDQKPFRHTLVKDAIEAYIKHDDTTYRKEFHGVSASAVETRRHLSFGRRFAVADILFDETVEKSSTALREKHHKLMAQAFGGQARVFRSSVTQRRAGHVGPATFQTSSSDFLVLELLAEHGVEYVRVAAHAFIYEAFGLTPDTPCEVTDDPEAPVNSPEVFEKINRAMKSECILVDRKKAESELKSIMAEIARSDGVGNLLSDI